MNRRDFLKLASLTAGAAALTTLDLELLDKALASTSGPNVIWLQGSSCTGCSVSFLNRISTAAPTTAADTLINFVNLRYHPQVMALAGDDAVAQAEAAYNTGKYILVVEGGVPTAFGGAACWAWSYKGRDVTFLEAVTSLASKAAAILSVGTCAAFGGIAAAAPNPAAIKSVGAATGKSPINIAGCPPHPDWIIYVIAKLLTNQALPLDSLRRPTAIYGRTVHSQCPRRERDEAESFVGAGQGCLKELGCRGPETRCNCPVSWFNNGVNWCIGAGAPCTGCTEPSFSGTRAFWSPGEGAGGDDSTGDRPDA